jgi:hypothetical protein
MSPLGIVLFGVGAAAGILVGLPVAAAAGVGALAWGGRVLAAVPRDAPAPRIDAKALAEPWRGYVQGAQDAKRRFDRTVAATAPGPLHDRLAALSARLQDGVEESWRIAERGDDIDAALAQLNTDEARAELAQLRALPSEGPNPARDATIASLEAQLASAHRMQAVAGSARDRLRLLDARFDELVTRAIEVSLGTADSAGLGGDVDELVTELEALRLALEDTERATGSSALPPPETGGIARSSPS